MQQGDVVGGRFEIVGTGASGGMGVVHRALDRITGQLVALKTMHAVGASNMDRFLREADTLALLNHPALVRYVAHGMSADGALFLAMEWLRGEDLAERLTRASLSPSESVIVAARTAEGLAAAHAAGVVHRDVKPSNIFLCNHSIHAVRLLDFGVARLAGAAQLTTTGASVGTPAYMAPEQARGSRSIDGRADLFALGCVLFECLTGRPPFHGESPVAVLGKVLLEEPPRVRDLRPSVPAALDDLVARMLAKNPDHRPANAAEVAAALSALGTIDDGELRSSVPAPTLPTGELRLLSIVMARACAPAARPVPSPSEVSADRELAPTLNAATPDPSTSETLHGIRAIATAHEGQCERLLDDVFLISITDRGTARDLATHAARCALEMRRFLLESPIVVATGRGQLGRWPMGEVIDRAAAMLRDRSRPAQASIEIDELTASLLEERFEVEVGDAGRALTAERPPSLADRTLLGRPSPCVGREGELARLISVYDESASEGVARAVAVIAPPGVGKSRLAQELFKRLRARAGPEVWMAQADRSRRGSPLALLADVVRAAIGTSEGEPLEIKQLKVRARIAAMVSGPEVPPIIEFLCELIGAPIQEGASPILRAARQDPHVMAERIDRAWRRFIAAECAAHPVLIVLEDLQWGDRPTVAFLDDALGEHAEKPLMVLALARPELQERFPRLWAERWIQWVTLPALTRRAGEALVRGALGDSLPANDVARLVERAAGNAFFLEELIRAVADGRGDRFPATILATVQARLDSMEAEARRLLRAASLFGQVFWRGGVEALIGDHASTPTMSTWWDELVRRELIVPHNDSRFAGEREYAFRHAFVCEGAYAMLPGADRIVGHRCVGAWLERAGETDAAVLAEHAERGGEQERAATLYLRASEHAFAADISGALVCTERGVACGATGELLGKLRAMQARSHYFRGEAVESECAALEAMKLLPRGSTYWCMAAGVIVIVSGALGHGRNVFEVVNAMLELPEADWKDAVEPRQVRLVCLVEIALLIGGANDLAAVFASRLAEIAARAEADSIVSAAWIRYVNAMRALYVERDHAAALTRLQMALKLLEQIGDPNAYSSRVLLAQLWLDAGDLGAAEQLLETCMRPGTSGGNELTINLARGYHALLLARQGRGDEATAQATEVRDRWLRDSDPFFAAFGRKLLARVFAECGHLEAAEDEGRAAVEALAKFPPHQVTALARLARVLVARGQPREALEMAERAQAMYAKGLGALEAAAPVDLAMAEALHASGDLARARAWIEDARQRLRLRAEKMAPDRRSAYLEGAPEHARIEQLAAEWTSLL